jgi:uncharacterized protein
MIEAPQIFILLGVGVGIGFISGLLGIGGGIIMTPIQYWVYTSAGMDPAIAIRISFATTLAVVLPTAASGAWQHHRQGGINWRAAVFMGIFTAAGSYLGATLAAHIAGSILKIAFGILALIVALRMVTLKISDDERPIRENMWLWIALALPIGIITGLLGIGGGIVVVPVLVMVLRFCMRNAAGTSLAMMIFTSIGGIAGYIINGLHASGLPPYTLGYISWPSWIALSVTSISMAQVGAVVSHRVPGKWLNYIFVALVFYVGLDMLGVINWISSRLF